MGGTTFYYFNPDTEAALAHGKGVYTPRRHVLAFMDHLALLPALYAPDGASVLVPDRLEGQIDELPYHDISAERGMKIVPFSELGGDAEVCPWGWNHSLRTALLRHGVSPCLMPDADRLDRYRELAHRATTVSVFEHINDPALNARKPVFFNSPDIAAEHIRRLKSCGTTPVVKMPWSSSGRGVFIDLQGQALAKILDGHNGVMVEPMWDKTLDFATEWVCHAGKARFMGYSVFVNERGSHYAGNIVASQDYLRGLIVKHSRDGLLDKRRAELQSALEAVIAPHYDGVLGVDMLCDTEGEINPCVEVNLRMTMGHVALRLAELFPPANHYIFSPGKPLGLNIKKSVYICD